MSTVKQQKKPDSQPSKAKTTKKPATKRKAAKTTARRWDVLSAFKDYVSDQTISLADISKKYGVSLKVVKEESSRSGWQEARQNVTEMAMKNFQDEQAREIASANERHVKLYRSAQEIASRTIDAMLSDMVPLDGDLSEEEMRRGDILPEPKMLSAAVHSLKQAIDGERTVFGLPTIMTGQSDKNGNDKTPIAVNLTDAVELAERMLKDAGEPV